MITQRSRLLALVLMMASLTIVSVKAASPSTTKPKPAIAPFDSAAAKQFQKQWSEHIDKPVVHTNSLGMKLQLIPPGEFTMGRSLE